MFLNDSEDYFQYMYWSERKKINLTMVTITDKHYKCTSSTFFVNYNNWESVKF